MSFRAERSGAKNLLLVAARAALSYLDAENTQFVSYASYTQISVFNSAFAQNFTPAALSRQAQTLASSFSIRM